MTLGEGPRPTLVPRCCRLAGSLDAEKWGCPHGGVALVNRIPLGIGMFPRPLHIKGMTGDVKMKTGYGRQRLDNTVYLMSQIISKLVIVVSLECAAVGSNDIVPVSEPF